jgi:hypothetical protein
MTILFIDGFENYNALQDLEGMYAVGVGGINNFLTAGRDPSGFSIELFDVDETLSRSIPNTLTGVTGFAFKFTQTPVVPDAFIELRDAGASTGVHLKLYLTASNQIQLRRSTTIITASTKTLAADTWYYIEFKWLIDGTVGTAEVWVNGKKGGWIDESGINTNNGGNDWVDAVMFTGCVNFSGRPLNFDDFYILDLTGTAPGNDRLGDSIVETLNPSGVGAEAQWSPSAGANVDNVDEATPDGDTTFNSSGVVDDDDRFAMDELVNVPSTVFAVQVQGAFRNENAGARDVRLKAHDGVTEGQSVDITPTFDAAYIMESFMFEDHPTDANPWSTAEVNAMEAGYRVQA